MLRWFDGKCSANKKAETSLIPVKGYIVHDFKTAKRIFSSWPKEIVDVFLGISQHEVAFQIHMDASGGILQKLRIS